MGKVYTVQLILLRHSSLCIVSLVGRLQLHASETLSTNGRANDCAIRWDQQA